MPPYCVPGAPVQHKLPRVQRPSSDQHEACPYLSSSSWVALQLTQALSSVTRDEPLTYSDLRFRVWPGLQMFVNTGPGVRLSHGVSTVVLGPASHLFVSGLAFLFLRGERGLEIQKADRLTSLTPSSRNPPL